ncbi:hypothetical protein [Kocuria rosea]|uniref:hypothetical protein n=1 Tax=Kocuria rosea TaxID=1275 RepID=UPI00203FFC2B|nr:hypothetical protein [Kocuria rosea]
MIEDLDHMEIDRDQALRAVKFLRAYASTCLREVESSEIRSPADRENTLAWEQHGEPGADESGSIPAEIPLADAASALREAGQRLLYLDPPAGRDSLREAAALYSRLGLPYGYYLHVVTGSWAVDPPMPLFRAFDELHRVVVPRTESNERGANMPRDIQRGLREALRHPQQQAYLLLASAGSPTVAEVFHDGLQDVIYQSPNRDGVLPVGSLGTPVRRFWAIAQALDSGNFEEVVTIARHLTAMANSYAETMSLAQVNRHLWANAAAPVDVGDLDIAGVAALTARRYGAGTLLEAMADSMDDGIGMAPVRAGIDLATGDEHWPFHAL